MSKKEENPQYGFATVGVGGSEERKIKIVEFFQSTFKDNRVISVAELEDEQGYLLSVENPPSTGRSSVQKMWLSKESFIGFITASSMFWELKQVDMKKLVAESIVHNELQFSSSMESPFDK